MVQKTGSYAHRHSAVTRRHMPGRANAMPCQLNVARYLVDGIRWMERVMGIEPTSSAWKAAALPLSYTRMEAVIAPSPPP